MSSIRVIKTNDDFITDAGIYLRLLSGIGISNANEAIENFNKGFLESKFAAAGWVLMGQPVILEITKNYVDQNIDCFAERKREEPKEPKKSNSHLRLIK